MWISTTLALGLAPLLCSARNIGVSSTEQSSKFTPTPTKTQMTTAFVSSHLTTPPPKSTSTQSGNGVATPLPFQKGMTDKCNNFYSVGYGEPCSDILEHYDIPMWLFYSWNPSVGSTCTNLVPEDNVCVGVIGRSPTPTNGIYTPWAIQTGIPGNCNKFYKVRAHDSCESISSKNNIPLYKFNAWNPAVGSGCFNLIVHDYVCVGRIGYTPPATTAGAVVTPEPYQVGIVDNCNRFHKVKWGDSCISIAKQAKVSVADIEKWNRKAGPKCGNLWWDYYICTGVESPSKSA